LGKETARGGTGVACRARQVRLDRPVDRAAKWSELKLVLAGLATAVVVVVALGLVGWRQATAARQDRARLLQQAKAARDAVAVQLAAHGISARDPKVRPSLIDLSLHYNLGLTQPRDSFDPENSLAPLAAGTPMLGGVEFDVRGTIQVGGANPWVSGYPFHGTGIPIGQRGRRVHFLHGTINWETPGLPIAVCVMHCADGQTYEQPIRYGADVQDWWDRGTNQVRASDSIPVWRGQNPVSKRQNAWLRLYKMTWENPRPDAVIETIDFRSKQTRCGPFLVAITVETPDSPEFWMSEAQELGEKGEWAKALAALDQAAQRLPSRPEVWIARAKLLESAGQTNAALEAVSRAIELAIADTKAFATLLTQAWLDRSALLRQMNRLAEAGRDYCRARKFPLRETGTGPDLIDLSLHYNVRLTDTRDASYPDNTLAPLAAGTRTLGGVEFDVRGTIQLGCSIPTAPKYPAQVAGIAVGQRSRRIHFLHSSVYLASRGTRIGAYVIHCANGETYEQPIRYDVEVGGWWGPRGTVSESTAGASHNSPTLVWRGLNPANMRYKAWSRLFQTTWDNPQPEVEIESIDFHSDLTTCAPFLVAITVERPDSPEFWMTEAQRVREQGDVAGALAVLDQAVQRLPASPKLWIARGKLLENSSRTNEALEAFSRAIELAVADTNAFGTVLAEARLSRSALLKRLNRLDEAAADNLAAYRIPPRDPWTKPELLDLSLVYNRELIGWVNSDREWAATNTFRADVRKNTGREFDLRGLVRLAGTNWVEWGHEPAPQSATEIPVARHFARMHVVHGTSPAETDGVEIGAYVLHYGDGQTEALPIIFGEHLRDRDPNPETELRVPQSTVVAWSSRNLDVNLRRFYRTTYENPRPQVAVKSIDFISTMTKSGPFLIAITVEP
jgi:tetratricopeptide (TPR) repeat protein